MRDRHGSRLFQYDLCNLFWLGNRITLLTTWLVVFPMWLSLRCFRTARWPWMYFWIKIMYGGRRKLTVPKNKQRLHNHTRFNSGQKRAGIFASRSYTYLNQHITFFFSSELNTIWINELVLFSSRTIFWYILSMFHPKCPNIDLSTQDDFVLNNLNLERSRDVDTRWVHQLSMELEAWIPLDIWPGVAPPSQQQWPL